MMNDINVSQMSFQEVVEFASTKMGYLRMYVVTSFSFIFCMNVIGLDSRVNAIRMCVSKFAE